MKKALFILTCLIFSTAAVYGGEMKVFYEEGGSCEEMNDEEIVQVLNDNSFINLICLGTPKECAQNRINLEMARGLLETENKIQPTFSTKALLKRFNQQSSEDRKGIYFSFRDETIGGELRVQPCKGAEAELKNANAILAKKLFEENRKNERVEDRKQYIKSVEKIVMEMKQPMTPPTSTDENKFRTPAQIPDEFSSQQQQAPNQLVLKIENSTSIQTNSGSPTASSQPLKVQNKSTSQAPKASVVTSECPLENTCPPNCVDGAIYRKISDDPPRFCRVKLK